MSLILEYKRHELKFKFDAGTSRGVLKTKEIWIIKLYQKESPHVYGLGEISVIERLSYDYNVDFGKVLEILKSILLEHSMPKNEDEIHRLVANLVSVYHPAIRFALETACLDLMNGGEFRIYDNYFRSSEMGIPINGLIWMGEKSFMKNQIDEKLSQGFSCIKMKIGAIDFEGECEVLRYIRSKFPADKLTLRVDANGAFLTQDVLKRLDELNEFDLHSIEQPIMPRQIHALQLVCKRSPVPVALDEELIGVFNRPEKEQLLKDTLPAYIILKPALLGGFSATAEWISIAEKMGIGWWITSALESNIGLNAICQFSAQYQLTGHQGLGTGQLYENNFHSPLYIHGEEVLYNANMSWDYEELGF
jgi:L-alanine-DL-glutamate epimerase-like enolase superfamily enzyme